MNSITSTPVQIHPVAQSVAAIPDWFSEVTLVVKYLSHLGLITKISEQVRVVRRRFGQYEVIDFLAVLIGYALSGEPTLEHFYERVCPFATAFMALFGRDQLPHRSTLSRFLAALTPTAMEALRDLIQADLLARDLPREGEETDGLWDRTGEQWQVFDVDGTRQAARQRALPQTAELPPAHRRLDQICAPGYTGRKRGESVRTRTTILQIHTHQWLGTFGGMGNGDYRGELLRALEVIRAYLTAHQMPVTRGIVRLDGLYGDGAIVADFQPVGLAYVIRSKDYALLDLPLIQERLRQPPDAHTVHPETGTQRDLYDCPQVPVTATGLVTRVIVATHPASSSSCPIGIIREAVVYELFFTAFPQDAFSPSDVLALYLHRGAFETELGDEDREQDPDRWVSFTPCGQETWQILSQWMWNLRLELGHHWQPTEVRTTVFAPAHLPPEPSPPLPSTVPSPFGPPQWARSSYTHGFAGADFILQPDGTLRCPANHPLYISERRKESHGSIRVIYAARIGHCRSCSLRAQCQESPSTRKPRQVSAVLRPEQASLEVPSQVQSPARLAVGPLLWRDRPRCQTRRRWMTWLRGQRIEIRLTPLLSAPPSAPVWFTRAERAHWRRSWSQRLACNAASSLSPSVHITVFGIPAGFAQFLGLAIA